MTINPNQVHVSKIYPGNYTNVLRYWHEEKTMQFENANGVQTSYTNPLVVLSVLFSNLAGLHSKLLAIWT